MQQGQPAPATDLVPASTGLSLPPGVVPTETRLEIPEGIDREVWAELGKTLGHIGRSHQWWVGDWLNAGEREGYIDRERYDEAEELFPHLGRRQLQNYAWVAKQCSVRTELSWTHHERVASMSEPDQERWLTSAQANNWSASKLRKEIKGDSADDAECCPTCGRRLAAGQSIN